MAVASTKLEDVVHRIIYPMRTTSDHVNYDQQNLWMIDERLAFHEFLTSDRRLDLTEELSADSQMRPDLLVFQPAVRQLVNQRIAAAVAEFEQRLKQLEQRVAALEAAKRPRESRGLILQ